MKKEQNEESPLPPLPDAELAPEDDAVIGVWLRRSLLAAAVLAAVVLVAVLVARRPREEAPEQEIETAAPEAVVEAAAAPAVRFTDVTAEAGIAFVHENGAYGDKLLPESMGGGVAFFDHDGDGDLDVVLTQVGGPPLLLRNDQASGHHWLRLELAGKAPNLGALGARVEVTAAGVVQRREVMPTRSYLSQVERVLTFGLGELERVEKVEVFWPGGTSEVVSGLEVDRLHRLEQGG